MSQKQQLGRRGESLAADYLTAKGYRLVARNVRTPHGEIDLVAQKGDLTVFVEVKTRSGGRFGPPEIAVTARKREHMLNSAAHYAAEHALETWRIDVIAVETQFQPPRITHFENVIT